MLCLFFSVTALGTFLPVTGFIFAPLGLILMRHRSDCLANIADRIAIIVVGMLRQHRDRLGLSSATDSAGIRRFTCLLAGGPLCGAAGVPGVAGSFLFAAGGAGSGMIVIVDLRPSIAILVRQLLDGLCSGRHAFGAGVGLYTLCLAGRLGCGLAAIPFMISLLFLAAYRANMLVFRIVGLCPRTIGMIVGLVNGFLLGGRTHCAGEGSFARFLAGGLLCHFARTPWVLHHIHIVILVYIPALAAGIGSISLLGAGRLCNHRGIAVIGCRDRNGLCLCGEIRICKGCGVPALSAGSAGRCRNLLIGCGDCFCNGVAAISAAILGALHLVTAGCLCPGIRRGTGIIMPQLCNSFRFGIAAMAGVGLFPVGSTGCSSCTF